MKYKHVGWVIEYENEDGLWGSLLPDFGLTKKQCIDNFRGSPTWTIVSVRHRKWRAAKLYVEDK